MKNYILTRVTIGLMVLTITGSWLTACSPSGTSQTDLNNSQATDGTFVPQYPLSMNRAADANQTSIEN